MNARRRQHPSRRQRNRYGVLLVLLVLSSWILVGATFRMGHASTTGDLMSDVPVVDENTLNNAACGIASATMILDYYLPQSGPIHQAIDISAVAQYIGENYRYDVKTNRQVPAGTTTDQLQTGLEAASTAPSLHFGVPLTASWHTTDSTNWFSILQTELDAKRPVVLFIPNGGSLGWNWNYGHFIAVSGYTSDGSIIYHDPWDGKAHTLSQSSFGGAWGTSWDGNPAWWYMQVQPSSATTGPTVTVTPHPTTAAMPPTQTSCPPDGQGRAAVVEPLALGTDQNIVYIDNEGTTGALERYDVKTGQTTQIVTEPSSSITDAHVSVDGQWIFLVADRSDGTAAIQMVRMDGQGLQTLYCSPAQNLSDVQWSPDQRSVAFAVIASTSIQTTISLLNAATGQIRTLYSFNGPPIGCCIYLAWLDNVHLALTGTDASNETPADELLLLDTSRGGMLQAGDVPTLFQQSLPASGPDSFQSPCWDFAPSYDRAQLFVSQCFMMRYAPMSNGDAFQEGPSSIAVEPVTGGPLRTIYTSPAVAIVALEAISPTSLVFYANNYSSHAGQSVDTSQNGLWKVNTDGSGLTHLAAVTVGLDSYFGQIPLPGWVAISRDGSMYASTTNIPSTDYSSMTQSLFFGSLSGGAPMTLLTRKFATQTGTQTYGNIEVVGWTSI